MRSRNGNPAGNDRAPLEESWLLMSRVRSLIVVAITLVLLSMSAERAAAQVRIKDITTVSGVRENQLEGLGLVVGLNKTGGKNPETRQMALNLLQRSGLRADPFVRSQLRNDARFKTENMSVVTVRADLPAFARKGSRIDITVSAYDDAKSLAGGVLVMTPLFAVDGQVYALAAGPVSTGGFSVSGQSASVQKNHPTVGRIANGATVELETCTPIGVNGSIQLLLHDPDYETASRIGQAISLTYGAQVQVLDAGTVEAVIPPEYLDDIPVFLSLVGQLKIRPDSKAKVVINERTGTVVIGENVRLSASLVANGNLTVVTAESPEVSQPAPFSNGETKEVPRTDINVTEEKKPLSLLTETATVGDLAAALNALGVTPRDLSTIFQTLKASGALHAELEFN
ncbi:MAG: flagellar basal body P-ring protein FlgI [Planctomycetaceae bacterium]|nr:flagellar basal body P-ring protein FlgI [Planctomycetaceae bacterium]